MSRLFIGSHHYIISDKYSPRIIRRAFSDGRNAEKFFERRRKGVFIHVMAIYYTQKIVPQLRLRSGTGEIARATINVSEEHSQHVGQVYQEHYARLRHYFLTQLGAASEAEDCVRETIRHFFFFMEDRLWEAEYISVYLMRIAGLICSRKLAEKRLRSANGLKENENRGRFNKIRTQAVRTIKERIEFRQPEFRQLFLRLVEGNGR